MGLGWGGLFQRCSSLFLLPHHTISRSGLHGSWKLEDDFKKGVLLVHFIDVFSGATLSLLSVIGLQTCIIHVSIRCWTPLDTGAGCPLLCTHTTLLLFIFEAVLGISSVPLLTPMKLSLSLAVPYSVT